MIKIVLIVGASGVGKDSLLKSIKNQANINFVKRYITREPDNNESNYYVDKEAFNLLKEKQFFVSTWQAHGNSYGIARFDIKEGLNIISISRDAIKDFENQYEKVKTINITVPLDILKQRLENRARESQEQIEKRLNRTYEKLEATNLIKFDNSESLEFSSKKFLNLIERIENEF
ncbi:MAG: hypothetical protein ACNI25_13415 [Halarcobacter sp.]